MGKNLRNFLTIGITIAAVCVSISTFFESTSWFYACLALAFVLEIITCFKYDEYWLWFGALGAVLFVLLGFFMGVFGAPSNLTNASMLGAGSMIFPCIRQILGKLARTT